MSDPIKHECGIAFVRLLKPLDYYTAKYGTSLYGINKMYLLMEKQHNRGQDGAGIACIKNDIEVGRKYINRKRSVDQSPIKDIFSQINQEIHDLCKDNPSRLQDIEWLKNNAEFIGELYLGHLRYGTFGGNSIEQCHPFIRNNYWKTKNMVLAGNFNMTNVSELIQSLIDIGQHPIEKSDTTTIIEKIGFFVSVENERLFKKYSSKGYSKKEISPLIARDFNLKNVLINSSKYWDGGYVIAGMLGHGDAFVFRDPNGIRPAFYYKDDEVVVITSERPAIQTAFNVPFDSINEITPGNALIIKKDGSTQEHQILPQKGNNACSFERIYFSRGTDNDIYKERKKLGQLLVPSILKMIDHDLKNTVFSYVPNTASSAYYGLLKGMEDFCNKIKKEKILQLGNSITPKKLDDILDIRIRAEQIAVKDAKLRTFITDDKARDDLVTHVYDITYGTVNENQDNLVIIDDSIVRGTTLKQSIVRILDRLKPKKIIVVSSAPQVRYPDCYGIDMAKLNDFIAFKAAIELLKDTHQNHIINEVYLKSKAQKGIPKEEIKNYVKEIYSPFTASQISNKIAEMLTPVGLKADLQIIYQSIEDLHKACPENTGDWYFTGNYPTPGGNMVVNQSFINYIEGKDIRAY